MIPKPKYQAVIPNDRVRDIAAVPLLFRFGNGTKKGTHLGHALGVDFEKFLGSGTFWLRRRRCRFGNGVGPGGGIHRRDAMVVLFGHARLFGVLCCVRANGSSIRIVYFLGGIF